MSKALKFFCLTLFAAALIAPARAATLTNVLQTVSLQLKLYQQGATNTQGTKVASKEVAYTSKNLIAALQAVTGQSYGTGARLVLSTIFSTRTISTVSSGNLPVPTNSQGFYIGIGVVPVGSNILVLSSNQWISNYVGSVTTNIAQGIAPYAGDTVSFDTNAGYETIFTPATNDAGQVTNVAIVSELISNNSSQTVFTNLSTTVGILTAHNVLYPISNYFAFSTNSPEIVMETGTDLATNSGAGPNLASQSGFSISNLVINYFEAAGTSNLSLNLEGFVRQSLKVDLLSRHGTNVVSADIYGANSTWSVIGSGYSGGTFSANAGGIPVTNYVGGNLVTGYLTNTSPVVVQGTVTVSFLENLAQ